MPENEASQDRRDALLMHRWPFRVSRRLNFGVGTVKLSVTFSIGRQNRSIFGIDKVTLLVTFSIGRQNQSIIGIVLKIDWLVARMSSADLCFVWYICNFYVANQKCTMSFLFIADLERYLVRWFGWRCFNWSWTTGGLDVRLETHTYRPCLRGNNYLFVKYDRWCCFNESPRVKPTYKRCEYSGFDVSTTNEVLKTA